MTRWRDTDKTCVDIVYDTLGRTVSTLSTEGYFDDQFLYNDDEKCTTYLDAEGGETRYWYNGDGTVTRSIDPLGREETSVWENTRLRSRTDALGRTTAYDYNNEGEISRVSLPGGYSLYYDYNEHGQLTRLSAPGNQVWLWEYDGKGSMVCLTDPQGRQQQFSYSEHGDLLRQIMPNGATALEPRCVTSGAGNHRAGRRRDTDRAGHSGQIAERERPAGLHHAVPLQ